MNRLSKPIWMVVAPEGGEGGAPSGAPEPKPEGEVQTFTQADMDRVVTERLKREREATKTKYADYDDLKSKAEGAKTAEDRIRALEDRAVKAERSALVKAIQVEHGIDEEDAALFLTGSDEESLTAQAKRLAARESDRKQKNNVSPREGTPTSQPDGEREFARSVFGG